MKIKNLFFVLLALGAFILGTQYKTYSKDINGTYALKGYSYTLYDETIEENVSTWTKEKVTIKGNRVIYTGEYKGEISSFEGKYNFFTQKITWDDTDWSGALLTGESKIIRPGSGRRITIKGYDEIGDLEDVTLVLESNDF